MAETVSPHIVVVGSGLAGYGVLRELRKLAPDARLTLVTLDDGHFYSKPALSTALAKGKVADTLVTTPAAKMVAQLRLDLRRSEEHTSELQSLMRISYAVFCLKKKNNTIKRYIP